MNFNTALKNNLLNTAANGGLGFSEMFKDFAIYIYSGDQPATADDSIGAATLLGVVSIDSLPFTPGNITNALNFSTSTTGSIGIPVGVDWKFTGISTGLATWARFKTNPDNQDSGSSLIPRIDASIGLQETNDISLNDTSIDIGDVYEVFQCDFTL